MNCKISRKAKEALIEEFKKKRPFVMIEEDNLPKCDGKSLSMKPSNRRMQRD